MKIVFFLLIIIQTFARKYTCEFGTLYSNGKQRVDENDKPDEVSSNHVLGR